MKNNLAAIILAAGKGTRMKSELPKVLHQVCGRPMLGYVMDLVSSLGVKSSVVVLGHKYLEVRKFLSGQTKTALQKNLVGTADAVKQAMPALKGFDGTVVILYGDTPLLKKETIEKLVQRHVETGAAATILTAELGNPFGYGRILRDFHGSIYGIREEKDADGFEKDIKEINTGFICFEKKKLEYALRKVKPNNAKKEYYLTDTITILQKDGFLIESFKLDDFTEALGVNSRVDLAKANKIMQCRLNEKFMADGVTIIDPDTASIEFGVSIGVDTTIYPFTVIEKGVKIGKQCCIGPFVHLEEGRQLNDNVVVASNPARNS